jgi:hypothetical protein
MKTQKKDKLVENTGNIGFIIGLIVLIFVVIRIAIEIINPNILN